jgi:hypothetical protein
MGLAAAAVPCSERHLVCFQVLCALYIADGVRSCCGWWCVVLTLLYVRADALTCMPQRASLHVSQLTTVLKRVVGDYLIGVATGAKRWR